MGLFIAATASNRRPTGTTAFAARALGTLAVALVASEALRQRQRPLQPASDGEGGEGEESGMAALATFVSERVTGGLSCSAPPGGEDVPVDEGGAKCIEEVWARADITGGEGGGNFERIDEVWARARIQKGGGVVMWSCPRLRGRFDDLWDNSTSRRRRGRVGRGGADFNLSRVLRSSSLRWWGGLSVCFGTRCFPGCTLVRPSPWLIKGGMKAMVATRS